jgi:HEAT repeat protein
MDHITEAISLTLEKHAEDSQACERALRNLMDLDGPQFVRGAVQMLRSGGDKPAFQSLIRLLAKSSETIRQWCGPDTPEDRAASIDLARRLAEIEPEIDTKLIHLLPDRDSDPANSISAERVLELLDAIPQSPRIVAPLAQLIRDPNPRVRAKVTLLMGRLVRNARASEERLTEADHRVRANAIESLWGEKAAWVAGVLWRAAKDPHNRVAGNALYALYKSQGSDKVTPHILQMASHAKPAFRATAAWVMGQTGDPLFLPALDKLTRDLYALVRKNAATAVRAISER